MSKLAMQIRAEVKPAEHRVAIVPADAAKLIEQGWKILVEEWPDRCFPDSDYEKVGCTIVKRGSWPSADVEYIVGLKELPESTDPLKHKHIFFSHSYKNQDGWQERLHRFKNGGGLLLDLEFLVDDSGRRVAAFGRPAGIGGAAVGLLDWAHLKLRTNQGEKLGTLSPYPNEDDLVAHIKPQLEKAAEKNGGKLPRVIVIGAKGRVGGGATHLLERCGITPTQWDIEETKNGGPFREIVTDYDILVNCIYLTSKIPEFINKELLSDPKRKLSVVVDISCDYTSPNNPLPIYHQATTFADPALEIIKANPSDPNQVPLDVISIDHTPSLIPKEASENFSHQLLPSLLTLKDFGPVWQRAEKLYQEFLSKLH